MRFRASITASTLLLAWATRAPWLAPLLVANAVVGGLYMMIERHALREVGSDVFGLRIRLSWPMNVLVNVVTHVVLTAAVLRTIATEKATLAPTAIAWAAGFLLVDLQAVYPTFVNPIGEYVKMHLMCVVLYLATDAMRWR